METTLGRYRLVEQIASGGMGVVHRGLDTGWGGVERPVAVKLIAPALAQDPEFQRSFADEARVSFLVAHPNVVRVLDIGIIDGTCFLAMEWVDGVDLRRVNRALAEKQGRLPHALATLIAVEVARGLDYAHRLRDAKGEPLQLVHRDVSAPNILLSWEGSVKLSDFGIAKSSLHQGSLRPGTVKGKIGYMSPEQARGEPVDARCDVFALGVVLYEMLTGENPFTAGRTNEAEVMAAVRLAEFDPPRARHPEVPEALDAIVRMAMAPRREERFGSAAAMREALESTARAESYLLSGSELAAFLRRVLPVPPLAAAPGPAPAPLAFDHALRSGLERVKAEAATEANPIVAARRASDPVSAAPREPSRPSSAARPAREPSRPSSRARPAPGAPPPESAIDEEVPRGRLTLKLAAVAAAATVALVLGFAGGRIQRALRGSATASAAPVTLPPPTVEAPRPTVEAPPPTVEAPPPHPPPAVAPQRAVVAPPPDPVEERPVEERHERSRAARLSVASDTGARVFVDGRFVHEAPLRDLELPAGSHQVRVEGLAHGLHLLPREETVRLRAGERRRITIALGSGAP